MAQAEKSKNTQKLLRLVLNKFNSILAFSPGERQKKIKLFEQMSDEGLLKLLQVFDEAIAQENKFLRVIIANNPEFPKEIFSMTKKAGSKSRMTKKLGKLKTEIKNNQK